MKIAVFGATGRTGILFVHQAVQENLYVKLYCRPQSLSKLGSLKSNEFVEIIEGEFDDDFTPVIQGVDVVLSFLGPGFSWPSNNPLEKVMIKIMETMRKERVTRFITMGTGSITDSLDRNWYKMRTCVFIVSSFARNAYNDIVAVGNLFKSGQYDDLKWTTVRVGILKNANEPTGRIHVGYIGDDEASIFTERADWAKFVLTEISEEKWIRKLPYLSSV
ncbi:unnamed protein product [Adineta steineri]|uniref:NAD(P)-binding domain-containing protein n=1 Tax=Adineta steineri TaxID=433720 RepID=A0A819CEE8_9BILA|nr:unnamed protein product [Adineta steineri]CAF1389348.1 unnamed protein product [Adineta steineri]CAF3816876.1 unnamed protein product [Adineta steineri]CAF3877585.1 unnamed protein product [Adineta steineri]